MSAIIEEEPYAAAVVGEQLKYVCSHCFSRNEGKPLKRCSHCKVIAYCSGDCQKKDWILHKVECTSLVSVSPRIPTAMARLLGRLIIRKSRGDNINVKSFNDRTFEDLMHHSEDIQSDPERLHFFTCIAHVLKEYLPSEIMLEPVELMRYFGRVVINCFSIVGNDEIAVGEGIYLGLSALNHSCAPDAFVRFHGRTALLRSPSSGVTYSNKLTIPYTALDTLNCERGKALERQYYFKCKCTVCQDKERDGYALSIKCTACTDGVCLVSPSYTVLTCTKCATVSDASIDDMIRMNQEVEWFLEREKGVEDNDITVSLTSATNLYKKYSNIFSRFNLPFANLAYRIVNLALSTDRRDIALQYAYSYLDAYKRYIPMGHPLLTACLLTAGIAASYQDPPNGKILQLLEEARSSCLLSHGPRDPESVNVDRQVALYRTRLQNIS